MVVLKLVAALLLLSLVFIRWHIIDYASMPYATAGNWHWDGWILRIDSARLPKRRYEFLILTHETIEALLCAVSGVSEQAVTDFDICYEKIRAYKISGGPMGPSYPRVTKDSEPGDDPAAPYHRQHHIATWCERGLAHLLLVDWNRYSEEIEAL